MTSLHPNAPSDVAIDEFWQWFRFIAAEFRANLENRRLLEELDERVSRLGDISWEVGPGQDEKNALVITPDGAKEWLGTTEHIVSRAQKLPGWEFHSARPPRSWDLQFSIEGQSGELIHVDARPWRYVLLKFPDNTFDILVEQNNLQGTHESDRYTAAVILLDGILGEKKRLRLIGGIEPLATLSKADAAKASPMDQLAKHLASLQPRNELLS